MIDGLEIDTLGPVARIVFNRPAARNSLTLDMLQGMAEALTDFARRTDVRAVLIRAAGEQPFSAGYDMTALPPGQLSADDARNIHAPVRAVAEALVQCPHTIIGAARGYVFGAALDLYAHCDLRVCAEGTKFCMPPNRHGFLYPEEGMQRLAQVAGYSTACDMLLTAQPVGAQRAEMVGLVQRVLPAEAFEAGVRDVCEQVASNAPLSMRATKLSLGAIADGKQDRLQAAYERIAQCLNSADSKEARAAFRDKRTPRFTGE